MGIGAEEGGTGSIGSVGGVIPLSIGDDVNADDGSSDGIVGEDSGV